MAVASGARCGSGRQAARPAGPPDSRPATPRRRSFTGEQYNPSLNLYVIASDEIPVHGRGMQALMQACWAWRAAALSAVAVVTLAGCRHRSNRKPMHTDHNPRRSGYVGSSEDWRKFLSCWHTDAEQRTRTPLARRLIKRDVLAAAPARTEEAIRQEIAGHESRLGLSLPRSYVDFLIAYDPRERTLKDSEFLGVASIDELARIAPGWVSVALQYEEDASDDEYFVYGSEQHEVSRTQYLSNAILVGMHDTDSPFLLVLHPQVLTSDGEMEAEAFFHAGSIRTPSFAEMMRFLYFYKVRQPSGGSGITQEMMRGTCADLLPMKDVWWK